MSMEYLDLERKLIENNDRFRELRKTGSAAKPIGITIAVTGRCNSHCIQCSIWKICQGDIHNPEMMGKEMTISEILGYLRDPMLSDLVEVDLTGGEPYLREDIAELVLSIARLKEEGVLPRLRTIIIPSNGFLTEVIKERVTTILEGIKGKGVDFVSVFSLDGIGKTHDLIRGTKGAFKMTDRTITEALKLQKEHSGYYWLGIKTTITHDNVDDIEAMLDYAKKRGMFYIISSVIIAIKRFRNEAWKERLVLTEEDMMKIREFYQKRAGDFDFYYDKIFDSMISGKKKWTCTALYNYLFVDYDRKVYPCPIQDVSAGDLSNQTMSEILNSPKAAGIRQKVGFYPLCSQCTEPGTVRYSQIFEGQAFLDYIRLKGPDKIKELVFDKGLDKLL